MSQALQTHVSHALETHMSHSQALKTRMAQVAPRSPATPSPPVSLGAAARGQTPMSQAARTEETPMALGAAAWGESSLLPTPPRPSQLAGAGAAGDPSSLAHPAAPAAALRQSPSASSPTTHASTAAGGGAGDAESGAGRHVGGLRLGQAVADTAELERLAAAWRQVWCLPCLARYFVGLVLPMLSPASLLPRMLTARALSRH